MADTGAPWSIPYAEPADLVRDWPALSEDVADAVAAGLTLVNNFNAQSTITATNASWPVPTLASPVVKVTIIGGGGGGAGSSGAGGAGGNTSFGTHGTASGGAGGRNPLVTAAGVAGTAGFAAGNAGSGFQVDNVGASNENGLDGRGGQILVRYVDLTGVSTVNVTVGAGGSGGSGTAGGAGGRGEVIVEYVAG